MLGVHKGDFAAALLCLRQNVQGKRRLTGGLRTVNLDDTATRHAADTQRGIECQSARRDGLDLELGATVAVPHDGTLAEFLLDLSLGGGDHLIALFTRRASMNGTYGT